MLVSTVLTSSPDFQYNFVKLFRKKGREKVAKALLMGVSPLTLAACASDSSNDDGGIVEQLVSGTGGNDTFSNSGASERFEGGLGDDYYIFGLSGIDTIRDTGGNDTLRIVWRNADNTRLVSDIYQEGDDLVLEMIGDANVLTVSEFFTEAGNLENLNYYHDGGRWGEGLDGRIYSLQSLDRLDETYFPLIVGTQNADNVDLSNSQTTYEITMYTHDGDDVIVTGPSIDWVYSGAGDDSISTGNGDDFIEAGEGNDVLQGRGGSDILTGNGGADTFVFADGEVGTDTITDFNLGEGDKLDLSSYGITTEEAAEALMSDSSNGVIVTIEGNAIVTLTATTVADFAAADGWLV